MHKYAKYSQIMHNYTFLKFDKIRQFLYILRNLRIFLVRTLVRFYDRLLWKIIPDRSCNLIVLIYKVYITFKLLRG